MRKLALVVTTTSLCFAGLTGSALADPVAPAPAQDTNPGEVGGLQFGADIPDGPTAPGMKAKIVKGVAQAPEGAPEEVKKVIWAANAAVGTQYVYGGGHGSFSKDGGLDCSGAVSFALNGGNFLNQPLASTDFMGLPDEQPDKWQEGKGDWITVYANGGHAYMVVAGIRWDTSRAGSYGARQASRSRGITWQKNNRSSRSFKAVHPAGF